MGDAPTTSGSPFAEVIPLADKSLRNDHRSGWRHFRVIVIRTLNDDQAEFFADAVPVSANMAKTA